MVGTKEGGRKDAATNKKKYGEGFYARIGAKGGRKGGRKSRRGSAKTKMYW